jgi:hypothetical protein
LTTCPIGCTAVLKIKDMLAHVCYQCRHRLVDCPGLCGVPVRYDRLELHCSFCPHRWLGCDSGEKCCKLPLKDYFYILERNTAESLAVTFAYSSSLSLSRPASPDELMISNGAAHWPTAQQTYALEESSSIHSILSSPAHRGSSRSLHRIKSSNENSLLLTGYNYSLHSANTHSRPDTVAASSFSATADYAASTSIINGRVEFRSKLRLCQCDRHGTTALLSAVRLNDISLAVGIIKRIDNLADFDLENKVGDTALTLACRYGRLAFVQLLVEHGVNINHETQTGRTALIEAVKVSNAVIVDELIKFGASVSLKTVKHRTSAIVWARKYRDEEVLRILELGQSVEQKMDEIFLNISCGHIEGIRSLVAGGQVFRAGTLSGYHEDLKMSVEHLKSAKLIVGEWEDKVKTAQHSVDGSSATAAVSAQRLAVVEGELSAARGRKEAINKSILHSFEAYVAKVSYLKEADIIELFTGRLPSESIRISILSYGLIFSILHLNGEYKYADDAYMAWWPTTLSSMRNTKSTIQRLRIFQLRLFMQSPSFMRGVGIFSDLYRALSSVVEKEVVASRNASVKDSKPWSGSSGKINSQVSSLVARLATIRRGQVVYDSDDDNDSESTSSVPVPVSGKFVKGKWNASAAGNEVVEVSARRSNQPVDYNENGLHTDSDATFYFVDVMLSLLGCLHELSACSSEVLDCDELIGVAYDKYSNLAEIDANLQNVNSRLCDFRDLKEQELVYRLKFLKKMGAEVEANTARLKVTRLMNIVSPSGHTAISWAGMCHLH